MIKILRIGEICEILDKYRKPITKKYRVTGNIPYYGATGIVDWVDKYIFDETLVLVGEDGAKWASGERTAFIIEGKSWVNNHVHVLRPDLSLVTHKWLAYFLTSIDLSPWVTGLTVPKLNQAQLCSIKVLLPSLDEQNRIVNKLDDIFCEIDKGIQSCKDQIENYRQLKSCLLSKEFQKKSELYY